MTRYRIAIGALLATSVLSGPCKLGAQGAPFSDSLLPNVRRAAAFVPGDLPQAIRVVLLNPFRRTLSSMVEGGSADTVAAAYPVFQIKYSRGWLIVDVALDKEFVPNSRTFSDEDYNRIQLALRDARLVVVTHEHHDHVAGVLRSPYLAQVQQHTLLTKSQLRTLNEHPNNPKIKTDSATAAKYLSVEYDVLMPLAPGVVLIKAPGHTPGSQMVYVRTASGQEVLLAGDVAWHMSGISTLHQKPLATSQSLGEDRDAIAPELQWLQRVSGTVHVVVSHDVARIDELTKRGVLLSGFDLGTP